MAARADRARNWGYGVLGGLLALVAGGASASTLTFDYNIEFSGGQAPGGSTPWITATFTDITSGAHAGSVELTISTSNLVNSENVAEIDFNINPSLDGQLDSGKAGSHSGGTWTTGKLLFTPVSGTYAAQTISSGPDSFKADGDGLYDLQLMYPSGSGFNKGTTSSYYITDSSAPTLSANSFDYLSTPMGGHGPFLSAAHVQNTTGLCGTQGCTGSGWSPRCHCPPPPGCC